jgi:phosphatidylinositol alpha-mannosyltransferase
MKIAFVIDDSLDRPDGVQQHVLTVGAWLTSQGHDVHYLCSTTERTDLPGVHSLASNLPVTFNGNKLRVPRPTSRKMLREFLAEHRFDVLHVQMPYSPLFAARVVSAARAVQGDAVRIVGTFHILPFHAIATTGTALLGRWLRRNLRLFDSFISVSPPTVTFARRTFGIQSVAIPNPVNLDAFRTARAAAANAARDARTDGIITISFLGRLVPRKGARELVAAVAHIAPDVRATIRVRIAGAGPLAETLKEDVARWGLADTVTLLGRLGDDRPEFFGASDICVFPATQGESFGIVLIEAMAARAGVVMGGDNPGYRSVLGERPELLVEPSDPAAFALAMERLILDPELRATLHRAQQQEVETCGIDQVGPRILQVYAAANPSTQ